MYIKEKIKIESKVLGEKERNGIKNTHEEIRQEQQDAPPFGGAKGLPGATAAPPEYRKVIESKKYQSIF